MVKIYTPGTSLGPMLGAMLARYRIVRGKRSPDDPMPDGNRQDTRKHTKHVMRPDGEEVQRYLEDPSDDAWKRFAAAWRSRIGKRFAEDPAPFERLADLAREEDVWLGCSCSTVKNPNVFRCHTVLALDFMAEKFADLDVVRPDSE